MEGEGEERGKKKKRLQNALKVTHSESSLWAGQQVGPQSEEMGRKGLGLGRIETNRTSDNAKHTFHTFTKTLHSFRKGPESKRGCTISPWLMSWCRASFRRPAVFPLLIHDAMQHGTF